MIEKENDYFLMKAKAMNKNKFVKSEVMGSENESNGDIYVK